MNVEEFVNEYKECRNKNDFISKHILNKYINYEEKIALCENIFINTTHTKIDNVDLYSQNTPIQYMLFTLMLINTYTDVVIDFKDNKKLLSNFNSLEELNLINEIISKIPQDEKGRFDIILKWIRDDNMENTRTIVGFLDNNLNVINKLISNIQNDNGDSNE